MDLGKAKLPRTGLNTLHQAIHPVHGLAWTDGKQVCLTSLFYANGGTEVRFGDTNVIGQFEHVLGLFWGPLCCSGSAALLAVQHKKHVTVWQLQLSVLEQNKLLCTQTCEMSEPFPLLSQGCVWHPKLDVLAVLTRNAASVLFAVRVDNRRVKADVRSSSNIQCARWTKDGTRLVVAIGSELHSYIWNDAQKTLAPCSFCPIFDVAGSICAMESTGNSQVAVSTELPLDRLCGLNAGMAFDVPETPHAVTPDLDDPSDPRRCSFDSDRSNISSPALSVGGGGGPVDLTHILSQHRRSDPSPLLHLQRRDQLTGSGQDSSHLILVTYERKVTTTRKVCIPGILVPDIMTFDPRGSTVAVASNTCNMVLVYCVMASAMPNIQQISLQKSERPKGVCFLSDRTLLLMVGRQKQQADPAFLPPSSNTDKYLLRIVVKELVFDGDALATAVIPPSPTPLGGRRSPVVSFSPGISRRHSECASKVELDLGGGIKELALPGGGVISTPPPAVAAGKARLVEEVSSSSGISSSSDRTSSDRTSSDRVSLDRVSLDRASLGRTSSDRASLDRVSLDHVSLDRASLGRTSLDRTSLDRVSLDRTASTNSTTSPVTLENFDADHVNRMSSRTVVTVAGGKAGRPCSPRYEQNPAEPRSYSLPKERPPPPLDQLSHNMERIFSRFADMQDCLSEIRDVTRNGKKLSGGYPNAFEPPYIQVTCQKQLSENVFIDERRPVLLCDGKLSLETVRELFSLSIVEMLHGPLWVVLVADSDGFVPLTFKPKDELTVRNGKRKAVVVKQACPEESSPSNPIYPDSPKDSPKSKDSPVHPDSPKTKDSPPVHPDSPKTKDSPPVHPDSPKTSDSPTTDISA